VRTSETPAALADVCDRRAAFDWRAAVDFFAMIIPRYCVVVRGVLLRAIKASIAYHSAGRKRGTAGARRENERAIASLRYNE